MPTPIRVLILEENQGEVNRLLRELVRAGYTPEHNQVQTEKDYLTRLDETPDIILAGDTGPKFGALEALSLLQSRGADIPFILVTEDSGEENAVEWLKRGAADCLIKERLPWLGQSIAQAMQAKQLREEKRLAEIALQESEARFQRLTAVAQEVVYRVRLQPTPQLEYVSPSIATILGYTVDEYYSDPDIVQKTVHPEDAALVARVYNLEIDLSSPLIMRWIHKNGKLVWTEQYLTPMFDENGVPVAIEGIARDITVSKEAEMALRDSEERYRSVIDVLAEGILIYDKDGRIITSNESAAKILGTPVAKMTGLATSEFPWRTVHEDGSPILNEERPSQIALRTGISQTNRILRIYRPDGTLIYLRSNAEALYRPGETSPYGVVASFSDITESKHRERELEAIARMATALRKATTTAEMLPILLNQLLGILNVDGVALDMVDPVSQEIYIVLADGAWKHLNGFRTPPGSGISGKVIASGQPYFTDDIRGTGTVPYFADAVGDLCALACVPLMVEGQALGVLWAGRRVPINPDDVRLLTAISEIAANALYRARVVETLEERVAERTAKLEAANVQLQDLDRLKSKFVSDVSHELRTPITNLNSYLYLLDRGKPEHFPRYKAVLKEQVNRLKSLLDSILDLSRLDLGTASIDFAEVDLNEVVEQVVVAHIPRADDAGLRLELDLATQLPLIWGERNQLAQVVTNLVSNALNYTKKGEIYVSTFWEKDHDLACLRVEDTGIGIEAEDLPHLFERFYRGKQAGQSNIPGSGLGLGIVKEIVDLHRGKIEVKSEIGTGSIFEVMFPAHHRST